MNAHFNLKYAVLLALVAILIALNIVDVSSPVQAASDISPTIVPTHYAGERTLETGIVSITCRNRNHFEYHNEDKTQCGDAVAVEIKKDGNDDSPSVNQPNTPVIDDGGVNIPNDGGSNGGGSNGGGTTVTQHTNNGNHYGNDKPDNNGKDVKNQHNGENTSAEHHDEPKGKSK